MRGEQNNLAQQTKLKSKKTMVRIEAKNHVSENPISWERVEFGKITFFKGRANKLNETIGYEEYVILVCDTPYERWTSIGLLSNGWDNTGDINIRQEIDVISSPEELIAIVEEDYLNRVKNTSTSNT